MTRLIAAATLLLGLGCPAPVPSVASVVPTDGATGVARNAGIVITFNSAMDQPSTEAAFAVAPATAGSFTWNAAGTVMTWHPAAPLAANRDYTVTLAASARDAGGRTLAAGFSSGFTTGAALARRMYLLGRSVLEGWFYHWGWDGEEADPVLRGDYELHHRYIEGPDATGLEMVASARRTLDDIPDDTAIIFFKLCFVDFAGGSQADAEENLARNKTIADSVRALVLARPGWTLITGNALPVTAGEIDAYHRWNYDQWNAWLAALPRDRFRDLHLYETLADPANGALRAAFASAPGDAHPNDAGYAALDTTFDNILRDLTR